MSDKPTALLEGWYLLGPVHGPHLIVGFVTGHPRLPGHRRHIRTSPVLSMADDFSEVETLNTRYRLKHPVTGMHFENGEPALIAVADLLAERTSPGEHWRIRRGSSVLRDGISGHATAMLCVLDLLDRRKC